ncbi:flagellar basal-body MS-ring/collar protein FliF [Melaminivora alkalimesophila]|uniref:Flagellar M-ring protein n=1 Tax=Melaminivora alkalimesophila TaxID=1165852 RepID=A0A317R8Y6_9BURK|nr:flagellar basal-body MS-ring/collar protein FliF [Melaminivora alkalimesophila]PWW44459.1 flagellar M-ring protein FliF [Melaminivora alkalimesophila]
MPSAVAEVPAVPNPAAAPASAPGLLARLGAMERAQQLRWGALAALLLVLIAGAFFYSRQPDYRVLFAGLNDKDGGAIVAQLAQMGVPYKYSEGGGAILVPAERVHDARLRLATQGLPKGSVSGFELMENSRFGVTQFQERLNFQRGLEGELTRSIQALSSVQSARVHLALPNQNGFFREQQKPSASVLVSLYPGRFLDRAQLAGIVHLVASSVPELAPSAVSVLDDTGKLLSESPDGGAGGAVDAQQLAYVQQIEAQYTRRIIDLLEPVVGRHNVRAQVTAEVDFSRTDSTVEQHRPNLSPETSAVRSQQVLESGTTPGSQLPTGVPGAVSNQPPQGADAPINGPAQPLAAAGGPAGGNPGRRESVTNYEVDKTTQVTRGGVGTIKRVNAAVVVNYAPVGEGEGKSAQPRAFSPEQIEQMTALVRETIGFNKERGDSVNLMNAPFLVEEAPPAELPLWKQPEVRELVTTLAWPLGISLAAAILILGLARPALKARAAGRRARAAVAVAALPGTQIDAIESEALERPALPAPAEELQPTPEQARLDKARALARENPVAVASILKTWVNGE